MFPNYIADKVLEISRHLMLHEWTGTVAELNFLDIIEDDPDCTTKGRINIDYKYLTYRLELDYGYLKQLVEDELYSKATAMLVHELCHILVDRLYKFAVGAATNATISFLEEFREQAVQRIVALVMQGIPEELLVGPDWEED